MRSLHSNSVYFQFLDSLNGELNPHPDLASLMLTQEFPTLRTEEAKAIYCDWRHRKREAANTRQSMPVTPLCAKPPLAQG